LEGPGPTFECDLQDLLISMGRDRISGAKKIMTFCARCGKELAPNANFCHSCGASVSGAPGLTHYVFKVTRAPRVVVSNHSVGSVLVSQGAQDEVIVDFDVGQPGYHECSAVQSDNLVTARCRSGRGEFWPIIMTGPRADVSVKVPRVVEGLELSCRFGAVSARGVQGPIGAETLTGEIRLNECEGGFIDARAKAGTITLENVNARVWARISAGSISYSGCPLPGESWFRTRVGNVELTLLGDLNQAIEASTRVGEVKIDPAFGATQVRSEPYAVGRRVFFTVGSGANRLFAETRTGSIWIRGGTKA